MPREYTTDDMADAWADRQPSQACKCAGDMPGYCPGPASCPMCQPDEDEEARVQADIAYNRSKLTVLHRNDERALRDQIMMSVLLGSVA